MEPLMKAVNSSVCAPSDIAGSLALQGNPGPPGADPHTTPAASVRAPST